METRLEDVVKYRFINSDFRSELFLGMRTKNLKVRMIDICRLENG